MFTSVKSDIGLLFSGVVCSSLRKPAVSSKEKLKTAAGRIFDLGM